MSTRPRIPVSIGVACAALLLAGCSSSGTIGAGTTSSTGGSVTGGKTGGSSGGTGTDSGCAQAILAIQGAEKAQNSASPQTQLKGVQTSIGQLRSAAQTTHKPGGKDAMNKVADDLQTIINQAESGQTPSTQQALNDAQVVATICGV